MTMDFEELQRSWQQQPVEIPDVKADQVDALMGKWDKEQRKLKRNNIIVTILFSLVFVDFGAVYFKFREGKSILFGGSILMLALCMLVFLWVLWRGVAYDKYDPAAASNVYIEKYLQKLRWRRRTITHYIWVYATMLWIGFMFYSYSLNYDPGSKLKIWMPICVTIYIFGMVTLVRFTKKKKQLKVIDELIADIEAMKKKMDLL